MNWQRIIRDVGDIVLIALGLMTILFLFACTFIAEGEPHETDASSSSGETSASSQSSTTHATTSPATSTSAGEGSGSASTSTTSAADASTDDGESTSSTDDGDPSSSSSGDTSSSSGGELEPYAACGPECDASGMLCLWTSGPGCSSRWCGVCSPACDGDLDCGDGVCETQCVLRCDGGCPEGMDCVEAGAPFGESCMWPA